jgi:hypothetical protein
MSERKKKLDKFEFWKFGFVSDFEIRISSFPAEPGLGVCQEIQVGID